MPHKIAIEISSDTLEVCRNALQSLRENRAKLIETISNYPVICSFGNVQRVLEGEADVDGLIDELDAKVRAFVEGRSRRSGEHRIHSVPAGV